jgi:septal ring factor EnvC (AmiA/AmiB activator)
MLEFIIMGFTGTYLSYFISGLIGYCVSDCCCDPSATLNRNLNRLNSKIDKIEEYDKILNKKLDDIDSKTDNIKEYNYNSKTKLVEITSKIDNIEEYNYQQLYNQK